MAHLCMILKIHSMYPFYITNLAVNVLSYLQLRDVSAKMPAQ